MKELSYYQRTKRDKAIVENLKSKIITKIFKTMDFKIEKWSHKNILFSIGSKRFSFQIQNMNEESIYWTMYQIYPNKENPDVGKARFSHYGFFDLKRNGKLTLKEITTITEDNDYCPVSAIFNLEIHFMNRKKS